MEETEPLGWRFGQTRPVHGSSRPRNLRKFGSTNGETGTAESMRFRRALPLLMILAALSLAACGSDDSDTAATGGGEATAPVEDTAEETAPEEGSAAEGNEPAPSGEAVRSAKVEIVDFAYDPDPVTIQAGGKVIWQNEDSPPHTATADDGSFDTGDLEEGKIGSQSFKSPGTYSYFCEIHPDMKGTVEVVE